MLSPYQAYRNRVQFKGKTQREYVKNKVSESINSLIENSQYGFSISLDGNAHDVAILSTKTTQEYESANIIAPLEVGLDKGKIFYWDNLGDNSNNHYWIILQKMFRPDQPGFNGIAYHCTGDLKWIDDEGKLQIQHAYIRSGRITNSVGVTPETVKKYDNILNYDTEWNMVAATSLNLDLKKGTRFIIKGKAYRVSNIDNVSIDNVSILSLVDDVILDSDDVINSIAYKDEYPYSIELKIEQPINLYAGDVREMPVVIMKNGNEDNSNYILKSSNPSVVEIENNMIVGRSIGVATITVYIANNDTISRDITVQVTEDHIAQDNNVYIVGNDYIKWNTSEDYAFSNLVGGTFTHIEFEGNIKHSESAFGKNTITITVKDKYSGKAVLFGEYNGIEYSKTIYIKSV